MGWKLARCAKIERVWLGLLCTQQQLFVFGQHEAQEIHETKGLIQISAIYDGQSASAFRAKGVSSQVYQFQMCEVLALAYSV